MESSPLTKAHDHARAAAIATQTSDTTVAIDEHAQAAAEFANASKTTNSYEALRTLRLLEQQHKQLSELLKLPRGPPSQAGPDNIPEEDEKEEQEEGDHKAVTPREDLLPTKKKPSAKPPPTLSHSRYPGRNLSSSIASNLASARGIRASYSTQPLTPSVSNDQAPGSLEVRPRREGSSRSKPPNQLEQARNPSWVPPVTREDTANEPPKAEPSSPTPSEDGFSKFYSTFNSLINRLSAPLAFTGLPLVPEESTPAPTSHPSEPPQRKPRHKTSTAAEPDLSKIYSRATLRSLERDGHGAADSFYVVPTSGHTASYASVLNHENKEKRRLAASMHRGGDENEDNEDEDDFVDARESQAPMSPTFRKLLARARSDKDLRNIVEELHLENSTLKDVLDKVSKRLHNFELNSQSSHLALAQSLRLQRPTSPISSSGQGLAAGPAGAGAREEALIKRNRELEEQMSEMVQRMNSLEKDHLKLQVTLEKYRERWEKLKAGAKARRSAQDLVYEGEPRG
ncbi:hypothetical protein F5144DRAFT_574902 [Chaetomium tenue]|uniref:Uncharacterized protein n=1 Tax=Chaetomium tenue TaxID=1854479 RepID=A0ACB7PC13_9PEZI|nr:hypothetical protein F5144DRAFT_574902 [Chaetomium globosum]